MDELELARAEIDRIDGEMAALFEARMAAAAEIAAWKQARDLPVRDPAREREVLDRNTARLRDPSLAPLYRTFLEELMALSRARQEALLDRKAPPFPSGSLDLPAGLAPVYLSAGCLNRAGSLLDLDRRVLILTDEGVPRSYAETLAAQCAAATIYTVPQGEGSKGPETLSALLDAMLRFGLDRQDCLVALGGGVVGDLGGLAAGLYLRGIDCYLVPTTTLAMADAAVGGKNAVNLGGVKNVAGLFRQPRAVLMDPDTLAALPPRQAANGLAEILKMALTHDAALFTRFEDPAGPGPLEPLLAAALHIKAGVVAADETERDLRRVLNFGHTLGHGLEAAAGGRLLHGEAVALGMLPLCAPAVRARLIPVLERLGLPTYVNFQLDPDRVMEAIGHDKKRIHGRIETVFVPEVGTFEFRKVEPNDLKTYLLELIKNPWE